MVFLPRRNGVFDTLRSAVASGDPVAVPDQVTSTPPRHATVAAGRGRASAPLPGGSSCERWGRRLASASAQASAPTFTQTGSEWHPFQGLTVPARDKISQ